MQEIILPKAIQQTDTIGIIAPGGFLRPEQLNTVISNVKKLGYVPYYTDNLLNKYGYLAGTDQQRLDDLHHMFANQNVKAILCARGGSGSNRLLPLINYKLIAQNPKPFIGYSDITSLINVFYQKCGLITFHGAVGISSFNNYTIKNWKAVLEQTGKNYTIHYEPELNKQHLEAYKIETIRSGTVSGQLVGGNLSLLASLCGTPYEVDMNDKIVFIEEVLEDPYRIDKLFTQLIQCGQLNKAAGILMGVFHRCDIGDSDTRAEDTFSLKETLRNKLLPLNIPVLYGFSFGHVRNKCILPVGVEAQLDTEKQTLRLLNHTSY